MTIVKYGSLAFGLFILMLSGCAEKPIVPGQPKTANLDLAHQATMLMLVRARCDRGDTAAVVVTHDVNLAAEFADEVMLLDKGRTIEVGRPREVLTPELLGRVFDLRVLVDAHPISGTPRITPVHERQR